MDRTTTGLLSTPAWVNKSHEPPSTSTDSSSSHRFLKALDLVGGVGIVLLFGVLPTLIILRDRARSPLLRLACLAGLLFTLGILALEIMQEAGLLALRPNVEYHTVGTE